MNRPSYKELWLDERKDRDEQLQWIRDAVDGNAKFRNSEPPYSEEEELARKIMQMHARIAELEEENETLKTACDILRGDNNLLFKRLMSIETPDDLQTLKIVYVKEGSEVQE